jgi:hypothetical protein
MVRLALLVLLVWTAASVPLAVLVGAVLGSLNRTVVPARVVVRSHPRVSDLSSR